jgi:adenine phosphoribosyltransferase
MNYKEYIDDISDFPTKGITFRDIQPLLGNGKVFE